MLWLFVRRVEYGAATPEQRHAVVRRWARKSAALHLVALSYVLCLFSLLFLLFLLFPVP